MGMIKSGVTQHRWSDRHSLDRSSGQCPIARITPLLASLAFLLIGYDAAQAHEFSGYSDHSASTRITSTFGNLGIPTASERFFEEGRERLEQYIQTIGEGSVSPEQLLQVSDSQPIQEELQQLEDPRFQPGDPTVN